MYYIYEYVDPRTNLPFYIGKGKDNRMYDHINNNHTKLENLDKSKKIKDITDSGFQPIIRIIENNITIEEEAYLKENYYILLYGRAGIDPNGILTNKSLYGRPPTPVWDDLKKQKHSEFNSRYWTKERKDAHRPIAKQNAIKGGKAVEGTVPVVDRNGITKRISKKDYLSIDKLIAPENRDYVSTASKEGRKRLQKSSP